MRKQSKKHTKIANRLLDLSGTASLMVWAAMLYIGSLAWLVPGLYIPVSSLVRNVPTETPTETQTAAPTLPAPTLDETEQAATARPTPVLEATNDGNLYNGYWWFDMWVPGLPTYAAQFMRMPVLSSGAAVIYAPQVMEANVQYRGLSTSGMVGAVAVPFCSEIGHTLWILRPGQDWEGPFIVADCTRRNDLYGVIVYRHQVVEVDFETAIRWGMARLGGDQHEGRWSELTQPLQNVVVSFVNPDRLGHNEVPSLESWFLERVTYANGPAHDPGEPVNYRAPELPGEYPAWRVGDEWVTYP